MRVGNFSLFVPEGKERDSGHVQLTHGTVYTLRLGNHHHRRCDAEVMIDGKSVGGFRVNANQSVVIERPTNDQSRFTFFEANSTEAVQSNVAGIAPDQRGLIQVVFKVEKQIVRPKSIVDVVGTEYKCSTSKDFFGGVRGQSVGGDGGLCSMSPASAGITGLTGHSNQSFYEVANLDYDPSEEVTISIRLVSVKDGPKELLSATRSNPIPSAVA